MPTWVDPAALAGKIRFNTRYHTFYLESRFPVTFARSFGLDPLLLEPFFHGGFYAVSDRKRRQAQHALKAIADELEATPVPP